MGSLFKKNYLDILVIGSLIICSIYNGLEFSYYLHIDERVLQLESQVDVYEVVFLMILYKWYRSEK